MKDQHFDEEDDVNLLQQVKHFFLKALRHPSHIWSSARRSNGRKYVVKPKIRTDQDEGRVTAIFYLRNMSICGDKQMTLGRSVFWFRSVCYDLGHTVIN